MSTGYPGRSFEQFVEGSEFPLQPLVITNWEAGAFSSLVRVHAFFTDAFHSVWPAIFPLALTSFVISLLYRERVIGDYCLGICGLNDIRFLKRVDPGDVLRTRVGVHAKALFPGKTCCGFVTLSLMVTDTKDSNVFTGQVRLLIKSHSGCAEKNCLVCGSEKTDEIILSEPVRGH